MPAAHAAACRPGQGGEGNCFRRGLDQYGATVLGAAGASDCGGLAYGTSWTTASPGCYSPAWCSSRACISSSRLQTEALTLWVLTNLSRGRTRPVRRPVLVWDVPVRLFHWLVVVLVTAAYVTLKLNWIDWHVRGRRDAARVGYFPAAVGLLWQ